MIGDNELYSDTQIDGWNNSDIRFFRQRIRALAKRYLIVMTKETNIYIKKFRNFSYRKQFIHSSLLFKLTKMPL